MNVQVYGVLNVAPLTPVCQFRGQGNDDAAQCRAEEERIRREAERERERIRRLEEARRRQEEQERRMNERSGRRGGW